LPDLIGSGCLGGGCWGPPNTYQNYQSTKLPVCSGNVTTDGANMIRIGILKGYCGNTTNSQPSTSTNISSKPVTPMPGLVQEKIIGPIFPLYLFWIGWGLAIFLIVIIILLAYLLRQQKSKIILEERSFPYL
jgi:hypothetical protein